jgi:integrase
LSERATSIAIVVSAPRRPDYRDTTLTLAIALGDAGVVQRHLGHEWIQTTSDRYGHLDRKASRVVMAPKANEVRV